LKVSAIIPTYNSSEYIRTTIQSVINQTYKNIEVIIIDDGSTDNTTDIIHQYFPEINIIHQENGGASKARNTGINIATGELIAFLDSDDLWLPNKIEKQVAVFKDNSNVGLVTTEQIFFNDTGDFGKSHKKSSLFQGDIKRNIFWNSGLTTSSIMVRTSVLNVTGNFRTELPTAEDDNLWLRIAFNSDIYLVQEYLTKYRVTVNSLSRGNNARKNIFNGVSKHIELLNKDYPEISLHLGKLLDKRMAKLFFAEGLAYLDSFETSKAREQFRIGIRYNSFQTILYIYYLSTFMPNKLILKLKMLKRLFVTI